MTLTTDRQLPRVAIEIARLLLETFVDIRKAADRESLDSEPRTAAMDAQPSARTREDCS
jgi:hypothetical protein